MYPEIEPAMKRYEAVLNVLRGELYTIKSKVTIPDNCKYPLTLIQDAQYQKQIKNSG